MSTLELVIWHILGYSAIPLILLGGIGLSSLVYFVVLELTGTGHDE